MELEFDRARWTQDNEGFWLSLRITVPATARNFLDRMKSKPYIAELKELRKKRSLDANAYAWLLMGKIADAVGTSKDEVYLQMLERYGVYTHLVVRPHVVERVKAEWRTVRELGSVRVNGQEGIQLQCYFGSSTYDTKEMSTLIDGIVSECRELDIETETPEKLALMCEEWGR